MIECALNSPETPTAHGPLCVLGHYLAKEGVLEPLSRVRIAQKTVKHSSPQQKLLDALMGVLSGCKALYEIDCRVRPDLPLQKAFGRERSADQSAISKTLDAFDERTVAQLREAIESIQAESIVYLLQEQLYTQVQPCLDAGEPLKGNHYYWKTEYAAGLSDDKLRIKGWPLLLYGPPF